jgi:hypothetical protein
MEVAVHARLNVIGFRPETLTVAEERYRSTTLPMIQSWPGYQMTLAMTQRASGKVMMVSFWQTAQDRDASGLRLEYVQDLASYGDMIGGSMAREAHEVIISTLRAATPEDATRRAWSRVTTGLIPPDKWDAAIAMLTPMVADSGDNPSHQGSMMMANRTLSKIVIIGVWDSRRAIVATDDEIHAQAYLVRRNGFLTTSPTHEVYEIVSWG